MLSPFTSWHAADAWTRLRQPVIACVLWAACVDWHQTAFHVSGRIGAASHARFHCGISLICVFGFSSNAAHCAGTEIRLAKKISLDPLVAASRIFPHHDEGLREGPAGQVVVVDLKHNCDRRFGEQHAGQI